MIDVNTTSHESTHFLAAVPLIREANKEYEVASENWPYPTRHCIGEPRGRYYAEIWVDGMDWQHSYWYLEAVNYESPVCLPFVRFSSHEEENKLNDWDQAELFKALLHFRRNRMWIKHSDGEDIYADTVWPFLKYFRYLVSDFQWSKCSFAHHSQQPVRFEIRGCFLSPKRGITNDEQRRSGEILI